MRRQNRPTSFPVVSKSEKFIYFENSRKIILTENTFISEHFFKILLFLKSVSVSVFLSTSLFRIRSVVSCRHTEEGVCLCLSAHRVCNNQSKSLLVRRVHMEGLKH